jgi:hypothetical protein
VWYFCLQHCFVDGAISDIVKGALDVQEYAQTKLSILYGVFDLPYQSVKSRSRHFLPIPVPVPAEKTIPVDPWVGVIILSFFWYYHPFANFPHFGALGVE